MGGIPEVLQVLRERGALALVWLESAHTAGDTKSMGRLCPIEDAIPSPKQPLRLILDVERHSCHPTKS